MVVTNTVIAIFALLLVGWLARKLRVLQASDAAAVNSIVTNITGPAFIFMALYGKSITVQMIKAPAVFAASVLAVMGLAYAAARLMKLDRPTTGGLILIAAFGNTGFLGYPVNVAAFPGRDAGLATAVMVDQFGMNLPLVSIGVAVAASFSCSKFQPVQFLAFLRAPMFIATVVGLLVRNVHLPMVALTVLRFLADATVPLAMMAVGMQISRASMRVGLAPVSAVAVLKLVVLPALVFLGLRIAGVHGIVRDASVLESSMPPAIMAGVIASRYGANGAFASAVTVILTLFSIVVIPLVLLILR